MNKFKVAIGIFIVLSYLISSCVLYVVHTRYIIENKTDYTMAIVSFYGSQRLDEIIINPNDAFVKEAIWEGDNADMSFFDRTLNPRIGADRDSVVIIFEDKRVLVQYCKKFTDISRCGSQVTGGDPIMKNLAQITYGEGNQVSMEVKRKGLRRQTGPFVITFDNSDYERAVEL